MKLTVYGESSLIKGGATSSTLAVPFTTSYSSGLNTNLSDLSMSVTCTGKMSQDNAQRNYLRNEIHQFIESQQAF